MLLLGTGDDCCGAGRPASPIPTFWTRNRCTTPRVCTDTRPVKNARLQKPVAVPSVYHNTGALQNGDGDGGSLQPRPSSTVGWPAGRRQVTHQPPPVTLQLPSADLATLGSAGRRRSGCRVRDRGVQKFREGGHVTLPATPDVGLLPQQMIGREAGKGIAVELGLLGLPGLSIAGEGGGGVGTRPRYLRGGGV